MRRVARLGVMASAAVAACWLVAVGILATGGGAPETACSEIAAGTVAFAPAFWHLGPDPEDPGRLVPGAANEAIAAKLEQCASRFAMVFTQKAVSDALRDPDRLADGTPVYQMHRHNEVHVGTLEALACAAARLDAIGPIPAAVVAHDRHLWRARQALAAVLEARLPGSRVSAVHLGVRPYQGPGWWPPLHWAARETAARPVQSLQVFLGRRTGFSCSPEVVIHERCWYPVLLGTAAAGPAAVKPGKTG